MMFVRTLQHIRYYSALLMLYGISIFVAIAIVKPSAFRPSVGPQIVVAASTMSQTISPVPKSSKSSFISGQPTRIVIRSLNIDLPVDMGLHDPEDGSWTLSDSRAQYAAVSRPANDHSGMTLIYGHNNRKVFAPLYRLRSGDQADVYTANGYVFRYAYHSYDTVAPDNVSIFAYEGKPQLTLQTCSGNWDGLRRLHHFRLLTVEKAP